ncbi:MAG TPA: hypothetical protein VIJ75_03395 [Hanamia sp.]
MNWILLRVRLHQAKRQLNSLGIFYALILFGFLCIAIFYTFLAYREKDKSPYVFAVTILTLAGIHFSRSDKEFVNNHVARPIQNIFTEYLIFSFPFILPSIFTSQWFYFPTWVLACFLIAPIKASFRQRTRFPHLSKIISPQNFEWLTGLRKNLVLFIVLWILAIITCRVRILPLIFLWFMIVTATSFYQQCESLQVLFASSESPGRLIKKKIETAVSFTAILVVPILVINSIFNPTLILVNAIFLLVQITIIVFAILLKYTTYLPNENLKGNTIIISMVTIGALIPFLLPIPAIMCFRNYNRSIKNLKHYIDDPR